MKAKHRIRINDTVVVVADSGGVVFTGKVKSHNADSKACSIYCDNDTPAGFATEGGLQEVAVAGR